MSSLTTNSTSAAMTTSSPTGKRIAIIGSGIAGLVATWQLRRAHQVTLFESAERLGGHTATVDVPLAGQSWAVDTGFIVFNDRTYPNFERLMARLGVASQPTEMSFSVQHEASGLEYHGSSLNKLFIQRRNLLRPSYYRFLLEVMRFNREAPALLGNPSWEPTLQEYLRAGGFSDRLRDLYVVPMGAAIWSAPVATLLGYPARFFIQFFHNHGMLTVNNRPQWRVLQGGSRSYLRAMAPVIGGQVRLKCPVHRVRRTATGVSINSPAGEEQFDEVILACHSDTALSLLADPSDAELAVLGALPYQANEVLLHTDTRLLPRRRGAWASWNYLVPAQPSELVMVTYNMNILQGLAAPETFLVSLNCGARVDQSKVLRRFTYHHPQMSLAGQAAQGRWAEISGQRHTHFAGAYWRYGFHEDGVVSGLRVAAALGVPEASLEDPS